MTETLTRVPLEASIEWLDKRVTTDPPRYTPHVERSLAVRFAGPVPLRAAVLLTSAGETGWGLSVDEPSPHIKLRASFDPHDWTASDDVQVTMGFQRFTVTDARLKADPRDVVSITLPSTLTTAELVPVAALPDHDIELSAAIFAAQDTEGRRLHRWRVKPKLAPMLPPSLVPMTSGHQTGLI